MAKARTPRSAATTPSASSYADAVEVTWSLRLPRQLVEELDARVATLNAKGEGRWSRNGLVVSLLRQATREWKSEG